MTKSEILFYYESRQNPNGDPDAENQPRLMNDQTIMVTDVRLKRTIRDYAKQNYGYTLFVDYANDGKPIRADKRAKEIADVAKSKDKDYIKIMLKNTFDVPLFGALVTIRGKKEKNGEDSIAAGSQKLTGPMQFAIGRSVNPVNIIQPAITSMFVGDETKGRHTTIGRFYSVEYALIKTSAAINPSNLGQYLLDKDISDKFAKHCSEIPMLLWDGTNQLITRSKYPQGSVLYLQVDYKDTIYNDLPDLVQENQLMTQQDVKELCPAPFDFTRFVKTLNSRKEKIEKIKIKCIDSLKADVSEMISKLDKIDFEQL